MEKSKKMKPKDVTVDVLLATYNSNIQFLKMQIESILNQTHENIKLIISDDHSTKKEVAKILEQYKEKDKRVKVHIQKKNLGYLKNFEYLLKQSKSDYIMFADHDDIWYADKIKRCLEVIMKNDADLVYCDAEQIDEKGLMLNKSYMRYKNMPMIDGKNNILAFSRHIAIGCSQLFTKKIKEQMLPFKETIMAHDWISVYLASKQKGICYIDEPLFGYRLHSNNEFGGRSLKQNLAKWKEENGKSYKAYKKYRNRVVNDAYFDGANMCKQYRDELGLEKTEAEEGTIKYYQSLQKTKVINLKLGKYYKYLEFANMGARKLKEITIFHFPLIAYLVYLLK